MFARRSILGVVTVAALVVGPGAALAPSVARADGSVAASNALPEALLAGLAVHAAHFEEMKQRGAFTMIGHLEELDRDGKASERTDVELRSTPTRLPMDRITNVIRYMENGKDKTAEAQKKAAARRVKRLGDPDKQAEDRKKDLKLPFLASEQSRYVFTLVERDAAQPDRVRIAFVPKVPAENAIKGSAWVDGQAREVLTLGFSFSKNPTFVDHVDVQIVFGLPTELGRAPSELSFDGRGGFLFIRKHYRGGARLSDPRVVL